MVAAQAEHWKKTCDSYWEKIKAASNIIGRKSRLEVYRNAIDRWMGAIAVRGPSR